MRYEVHVSSKFNKVIREMQKNAKEALRHLVDDIRETGPVQPRTNNYSALGEVTYHCTSPTVAH